MQYWIFYYPGVGGDGFGCMLEHATNIKPADGNLEWRIDYYEGAYGPIPPRSALSFARAPRVAPRPVRFLSALWAKDTLPFRYNWYNTLSTNVELNPIYVDLVKQQQNTVITTHYDYFKLISQFAYRDIVEKDQVKIHLYSDNSTRVYKDVQIKRGIDTPLEKFTKLHQYINKIELARSDYDIHIDIEKIWRDWNYMQSCMNQLGIDLPKFVYDHYLTYIDNL